MSYRFTQTFFPSSNGTNQIAFYHYQPATAPIAVLQISHGMNQAIDDYMPFIEFLTDRSIAVVGADHLGHGKSINSPEDYGFFADADGYKNLIEDLHTAAQQTKELYPNLPHAILAHSMGTFVARLCMGEHPEDFDAAILCGTSGSIKLIDLGIAEVNLLLKEHDPRYRIKLLYKHLFKSTHTSFDGEQHTALDWVSRDKAVVARYLNSEHAAFIFTLSALKDLFTLIKLMSERECFDAYPKKLPTYLLTGEEDPVGQFTKGVSQVHNKLKEEGVQPLAMKVYSECRHELLGELNKEEVYLDILYFLTDALQL